MDINDWARDWGVSHAAMMDFRARCGMLGNVQTETKLLETEGGVQNMARIREFKDHGAWMLRNNVGAGFSEEGQFMRWGLANDSKEMNKLMKSSDLIGVQPVVITPAHVGMTLGLFRAIECKKPGWQYTGDDREKAQLVFGNRVLSLGGLFEFRSGY